MSFGIDKTFYQWIFYYRVKNLIQILRLGNRIRKYRISTEDCSKMVLFSFMALPESRQFQNEQINSRFGTLAGAFLTTFLCSSEITPSSFHLFQHLKMFHGGHKFNTDDKLKGCGTTLITMQVKKILQRRLQEHE